MPTAPVRASEISFNEGLIRLAAVHDRTVEFRYAKGEGAVIETRRLEPSDVNVIDAGKKTEHVTFTGFDPDRAAVRHYRLDRIKGDARIV